jgi:hypothetical protein
MGRLPHLSSQEKVFLTGSIEQQVIHVGIVGGYVFYFNVLVAASGYRHHSTRATVIATSIYSRGFVHAQLATEI